MSFTIYVADLPMYVAQFRYHNFIFIGTKIPRHFVKQVDSSLVLFCVGCTVTIAITLSHAQT